MKNISCQNSLQTIFLFENFICNLKTAYYTELNNLVVFKSIVTLIFLRVRTTWLNAGIDRVSAPLGNVWKSMPRFLSLSSVTNNSRRSGRLLGIWSAGPIRPCQIRIAVLDRLALLSVRTSGGCVSGPGARREGGGQTPRQIHKDDRAPAPLSRNLYKWDTTQEKSGCTLGGYAGINPGRPAHDILEETRIFFVNEGRGNSGSRLCIRLVGSRLCNDLSLLWILDRDLPIQI